MSPDELRHCLRAHIPISQAMQIDVIRVDAEGVTLAAPLAPNINLHQTVFGGSAAAVATLSAWSLLHTRLVAEGIRTQLVIQRNTMSYLLPMTGDFTATAGFTGAEDWRHFMRALRRKHRARISVQARLMVGEQRVGEFDGEFVAIGLQEG
jgi:thioesterase domain-containing protein